MKVGVVVFPGTNCDRDTAAAIEAVGSMPTLLWHAQAESLRKSAGARQGRTTELGPMGPELRLSFRE